MFDLPPVPATGPPENALPMDVRLVDFPETKVAALEHHGAPELEYATARKLIDWRIQNRLSPERHRSYGIHYTDPRITPPALHRVDFCVSVEHDVAPNAHGVVTKLIPGGRCAFVRYIGPCSHIPAAAYLYEEWLPRSGELPSGLPMFFHYVNVGPGVREEEMITDVYLPLR